MKTKTLLLFVLCLLAAAQSTFAQMKNRYGRKMVKTINVRWYEKDGRPMNDLSLDVTYNYDEKRNLNGFITITRDADDNTYRTVYKTVKDGEAEGSVYKNGKLVPLHKIRLVRRGDRYREETFPTLDEDGSVYQMNKQITIYGRSSLAFSIDKFSYYGFKYDPENSQYIFDVNYKYGLNNHITNNHNLGIMRRFFGYWYDTYVNKDGYEYHSQDPFDPYSHIRRGYVDQNMQKYIGYNSKGDITECNLYSDRLNDTNVEFYGFSTMTNRISLFRNVELSTEWYEMQSKNLLLAEGYQYVWGKTADETYRWQWSETYATEREKLDKKTQAVWNYEYDERNNIKRIVINTNSDSFNRRCIINVDYVF